MESIPGYLLQKDTKPYKYRHFRFSSSEPGKVFIREFSSSAEFRVSVIKDQEKLQTVLITDPEIIRRSAVSAERAWYLYENVRQHCEGDIHKDTTCRKPSVPKPRSMKAHKIKMKVIDKLFCCVLT